MVPHGSIVVYTAISGNYDVLKPQPHTASAGASFIAFLDQAIEAPPWRSHPIHTGFADPNRNAKIHKLLPHTYFPNASYSLWIDGSVTIQFAHSISRLIERYLAACDLVVFQHRMRTCVYQEASICLQRRLDDPAVIWQQICRYTRAGYPANAGLAECPVILRRHTPAVNAFNEAWWEEITHSSRRDQLSFNYVARKLGLRYAIFPGDIHANPLFHRDRHVTPHPETDRGDTVAEGPDAAGSPAGAARQYCAAPPRGLRPRRTIAFGRMRDKPSWNWVGFDVARELSKYYNVVIYDSWLALPEADVVFVVKKRPPEPFVTAAREKKATLVYCPIDAYPDEAHLAADADFLRACAMVVVHCERFAPLVQPFCDNVHFVEHHTRYALQEMAEYKDNGFVLWIGACQYVPYLVHWLHRHPIDREIRILTDVDNGAARDRAHALAAEIGVELELHRDTTSIAGGRVSRWSERRQDEMMRACKAAIDVKMTATFNQRYKPPTKAQQYVASGIPFAVNPDSYSAEYFRVRGFDVASPLDAPRWLSQEYWEATRIAGERLRTATSLEAVGLRYRELIESLCAR